MLRGGVSQLGESLRVGERFKEIRFGLQQESNNHRKEGEDSGETNDKRSDGFEPFVNPEGSDENLFVNNYGGNFSQKMELNRKGVETALKIAHLDGQVFLASLPPSRSRSAEAQGEELAAKRFLFFGEKTQKAEEENPYKRVVSVPEGWRIEINDSRITDELTERKLSGKRLQKTFVSRFNGLVKEGIRESVWREKLSSEKDKNFLWKISFSLFNPTLGLMFSVLHKFDPAEVAFEMGITLFAFNIFNIHDTLMQSPLRRNLDHVWEYFMPRVEIDKVARAYAYLAGKGRRLVKEIKEENNCDD